MILNVIFFSPHFTDHSARSKIILELVKKISYSFYIYTQIVDMNICKLDISQWCITHTHLLCIMQLVLIFYIFKHLDDSSHKKIFNFFTMWYSNRLQAKIHISLYNDKNMIYCQNFKTKLKIDKKKYKDKNNFVQFTNLF